MTLRAHTKPVYAKGVKIGGGDVVVQSMCNTKTADVAATLAQIRELEAAGCQLVRLAVPDLQSARAFDKICSAVQIPVAADIHFDYRLALECVQNGAAKIRINPGNIGGDSNVKAVAHACREAGVPIRIGVNMGSISREAEALYGRTAQAMAESALYHVSLLNRWDFDDIVLSLKASDVRKTVEAYRMMSARCAYPLHLGVTEAGTAWSGLIKSAAGIGALLLDGIGDTIRVSLTAPPVEEVRAANQLLRAVGLKKSGVELISCPSCGRCNIDQVRIANLVEQAVAGIDKPVKVAVMGCAVNGPGEARDADIGIAGGDGCAILFKKGEIVRKIAEHEIVDVLLHELGEL